MDKTTSSEVLPYKIPERLPVVPVTGSVVFPMEVVSLQVSAERNLAIFNAIDDQTALLVLAVTTLEVGNPQTMADLAPIGILARVVQKILLPNNAMQVVLQGITRVGLVALEQSEPFPICTLVGVNEEERNQIRINARIATALELVERLITNSEHYSADLINIFRLNVAGAGRFCDLVASHISFPVADKQRLIEIVDVEERLDLLCSLLEREAQRATVMSHVHQNVQIEVAKAQREYFLREEMKEIRRELGEEDAQIADCEKLREKVRASGLPADCRKEVDEEIERLALIATSSPEYTVLRNYIEWIADLPWKKESKAKLDIAVARRVLDEDHYGLHQVKERIIEFLSVMKLKGSPRGPVLLLVGPPGVGKTSLGRSIARATGRKFVKMSVGGLRDEAEIKGHRRTYVGAMPGKLLQSLRRAGAKNPVFMIDEIDKLANDAHHGDPASALLEALDPAQNSSFQDHYLDMPFDLSKVFFICTANIVDSIPPALLDRMEQIHLPGYTEMEKLQIAKRYLLPRQIEENGLRPEQVRVPDSTALEIVRSYTREAGMRNLERQLAQLCRRVAVQVAEGKKTHVLVKHDSLCRYLGPARFTAESAHRNPQVGVATGLAWTPAGGALLFIEATRMKGSGNLQVTGHLGPVMQESVSAALSYVRANCSSLCVPAEAFNMFDVHIHFPEGATPKDGPSAGVAVATAFVSLFTEKPVRADLAMSGEITLRGKVLPVGGIREKLMAAAAAGIHHVILPAENRRDLADVPKEVLRLLQFQFVESADDIFEMALLPIFVGKEGMEFVEAAQRALRPPLPRAATN